jgi:hypothetical protein
LLSDAGFEFVHHLASQLDSRIHATLIEGGWMMG